MIAQHEAAIALLQMVGSSGVGREPVVGWIVIAKFERRGLRVEANQATLAALDDTECLVGSGIEPIPRVEQDAQFEGSAGGAGVTSGGGLNGGRRDRLRYVDCWEISRSVIRWRNSRRRICGGVRRCRLRNWRRLRSIRGIHGNAVTVPHSSAVAAVSFPRRPG